MRIHQLRRSTVWVTQMSDLALVGCVAKDVLSCVYMVAFVVAEA